MTCKLDGCDRPVSTKGWCLAHYTRIRRTGSPGSVEVWDRQPQPCRVDDCGRALWSAS